MIWLLYFWGYSLLLIYAYIILYRGTPTFWDYIDFPLSTLAMIGVFGFAHKLKILTPSFWRIWLLVIIIWDLTYNFILTKRLGLAQKIDTESDSKAWDIGIWLIVLPKYAALYLYSYKSMALWQSAVLRNGAE